MAALNKDETESLSLACRAMADAQTRLKRAVEAEEAGFIKMELAEVGFMVDNLKKAERMINSVKQMKGYYPK